MSRNWVGSRSRASIAMGGPPPWGRVGRVGREAIPPTTGLTRPTGRRVHPVAPRPRAEERRVPFCSLGDAHGDDPARPPAPTASRSRRAAAPRLRPSSRPCTGRARLAHRGRALHRAGRRARRAGRPGDPPRRGPPGRVARRRRRRGSQRGRDPRGRPPRGRPGPGPALHRGRRIHPPRRRRRHRTRRDVRRRCCGPRRAARRAPERVRLDRRHVPPPGRRDRRQRSGAVR